MSCFLASPLFLLCPGIVKYFSATLKKTLLVPTGEPEKRLIRQSCHIKLQLFEDENEFIQVSVVFINFKVHLVRLGYSALKISEIFRSKSLPETSKTGLK